MRELAPYFRQLRKLPFVKEVELTQTPRRKHGAPALDADVDVVTTDGRVTFAVEHKRSHLSQAVAEHLLHVRARVPNLLLFAPHVGRELAERFGRERLNFVDLAGNCHVQIGDRFFVHVEGRRHEAKPPSARAFRAPSYRVMFALLANPELAGATARDLADAAGGVSPQTAIDARARLVERGLLVGTAQTPKWSPRGWKSALDTFVEGFLSTLAPQLAIGRFRAKERDTKGAEEALQNRLAAIRDVDWRWGGGAASARLTSYYRGDKTLLYIEAPPDDLARQLQLRPDNDGPIFLATSPGPLAFVSPADDCVHPLLAYVDLIAEGDERARDGAAELYRRYLEPIERARK